MICDQTKEQTDVTAYWNRTCERGRYFSHWRSARPADWWEQIGLTHGAMLREQWPEVADDTGEVWIEWGPGGGANAVMLAEFVGRLYGVDISRANLEACRRELVARCFHGFESVLIDVDEPERVAGLLLPADGFLSTATFQHFPSKQYTERVVGLIPQVVRPGGYVFIQIRRDSPRDYAEYAGLPYQQRALYATVYGVEEFGGLLASAGIEVEKVKESEGSDQYVYFWGRVN